MTMRNKGLAMQILRVLLLLIGILGVLDTLLVLTVSTPNLGVLLPAVLCAPLFCIGLFWNALGGFCAAGFGRALKWIVLCGYLLLFAAFSITWVFIDSAARKHAHAAPADAVIVLGAGLRGESPTLVLRHRLDTAIAYLQAHPDAIAILSGGQGEGEAISEAEAMARYMQAAGIPQARYIKESASRSTHENFAYSLACIEARGLSRIAYVTTDFHIYRAGMVARKQGINAFGIPAPDVWYISLNNHLRECVAIWGYFLIGSI